MVHYFFKNIFVKYNYCKGATHDFVGFVHTVLAGLGLYSCNV
jgi:hypothetical protein